MNHLCPHTALLAGLLLATPMAYADSTLTLAGQTLTVGMNNAKTPVAGILTGGQPTADDLALLQKAGLKTVIDLRPATEPHGFNEAARAAELGLRYIQLAIAGAGDITPANAEALAHALTQAGNKDVLVHCASSNRVGALFALNAKAAGKTTEEAIAIGKAAGLTGLETVVRARLDEKAAQ